MFRKAVSTLEGVKSGRSGCESGRTSCRRCRCRLQLPTPFQYRCGDLHVADELYLNGAVVSLIIIARIVADLQVSQAQWSAESLSMTRNSRAVFMIRASNFPVLLAIAVYERQQYNDTSILESIGDYAEKYLGSLPRVLRSAG